MLQLFSTRESVVRVSGLAVVVVVVVVFVVVPF
ncbi:hypothetical protein A2U01_0099430, partial [Trifolium medium]|nr:hypothetical protein [Trifolium medium]